MEAGAGRSRLLAGFRGRRRSVLDILVVVSAAASLISPWSIAIQPAHLPETFGFESLSCWLSVAGLMASVVLEARLAVVALLFTEAVLAAWFGWALWVVTTPRFAGLPFPFTPTDLMGAGWYAAAIGLLLAAGALVRELYLRHAPPGAEVWLLTAIPGFGLMRLGRWLEGAVWAGLFTTAFYLASTQSPDSTEFYDLGRFGNVPTPYPRAAEWALLGAAAAFWIVSAGVTVWRRRSLQTPIDSD